jgi:hypothetical protein
LGIILFYEISKISLFEFKNFISNISFFTILGVFKAYNYKFLKRFNSSLTTEGLKFFAVINYEANSIFLTYNGETRNGVPFGSGKMIYRNGDKYEGEWRNGNRHGNGNLTFAENDEVDRKFYSGNWENDQRTGSGLMIWKDGQKFGEKYVGEFENGSKNGFGKSNYADGNTYEGEFKDDKFSGNGTFTWKSGGKYVGGYKNGLKNGFGILYSSTGEAMYEGQWKYEAFISE